MRQFRFQRTYAPPIETYRLEGTGFQTSWHVHREYQIVAMEQGVRRFIVDGLYCEIGPGDIAVIPPFTVHSGIDNGTKSRFRSLYLDAEIIDAPLRSASSYGTRSRLPFRFRDEELFPDIMAAAETIISPSRMTALFERAVALHRIDVPLRSSTHTMVRKARAFIERNYRTSLSLDEIAGAAGASKYHLARRFSIALGLAPHAYQLQLRIMAVKTLLNEGCSVTDAARREGFCDASHLNRHFRAITGLSPREYLRHRN